MAKVCDITGKKTISGNNVSHANNKTKRKFLANLQLKKFYLREIDAYILLRVTANAMRTINKNGLLPTMMKAVKKGTLSSRLTPLVAAL